MDKLQLHALHSPQVKYTVSSHSQCNDSS